MDREWAFGGADGTGVTVAIVDSGVERDHPAVGGRLVTSVRVELGDEDPVVVDDPEAVDVVGHGTACAGIIHSLAPARRHHVGPGARARQPGQGTRSSRPASSGRSSMGATVVNLSLSSKSEAMFAVFHELADAAYFANVLLVSAANNVPGPSYPSLFASVVSVAAHDVADPWTWFYNPAPPVEFGAYGRRRRGRLEATAGGSSPQATASPRRTSPGWPRSSGRSTPGRARSRSRRSWRPSRRGTPGRLSGAGGSVTRLGLPGSSAGHSGLRRRRHRRRLGSG